MTARLAPTARQVEVVEAVRRHGSPQAAAGPLGVSRQTVENTIATYHLRVCEARIDELEHEIERLRPLADVARVAERLEIAARGIEQGAISHRRLADGGERVKEQRKRQRSIG